MGILLSMLGLVFPKVVMHRLLKRQIKRNLEPLETVPDGWEKFLASVSDAYEQADSEQRMLERTVELNSKELLELTSQIRAAIPDTFLRLDTQGTILDYKESLNQSAYLPSSDVVGKPLQTLLPEAVNQKFTDAIELLVLQQKSEVSIIHELSFADGKHYYEVRLLPLLDNQVVAIIRDITERKLAESALQQSQSKLKEKTQRLANTLVDLKKTQSQLVQTEKKSSLGQMVAGIAHEINNPINFIHGNLDPLRTYFQDLRDLLETYQHEYPHPAESIVKMQQEIDLEFMIEDATHLLNSMQMGTTRVADIVVSLRNYSRLDESTIKDVDIHEGLESTLLILNHRIKCGGQVIKNYGALPKVRCSPAQLNQVYTNIIANALDAMSEPECNSKQLIISTRAISSEQIQISIRDSGVGIPTGIKTKIFDPFFTTKTVGQGTGLGLGICFKIVQQHQGTIEVKSTVGQGSEFIITLPTSGKNDVS